MFKKINYQRDLKNLINSINIKMDSIGYQIQYYLYKNKGYPRPDRFLDNKKEWKYYINLSGHYHSSDTEMYLYNRYIDSEMKLTVENINNYPEFKDELLSFGETYENLVKKYPSQESLIKYILLPVDIDYAIAVEDFTIINYNKKLVDKKEYSLIPKIQTYINGYFSRWYIEANVFIEDLYLATMLGVLYSNLYLEVESIRLSNIFTYEAHDYYIDMFFSSHLDTAEDINILPENVKMWLYKNLRYIERHTGKNDTLKLIVEKLFTDSGIGIGEINLIKEDSSLNLEDLNVITNPSYNTGDKVFKTNPLNDYYIANRNKEYDLSQITKKELMLSENSKLDYDVIYDNELAKVNTAKYLSEKTKILEFDDKIVLRSRTIPEMHVIVDNWFYYAFNNRFNHNVEIKDENTNLVYSINAKQGALMLLKVMLASINRTDVKIGNYKASTVLRRESDIKSSINRLFIDRDISDTLTNAIFDTIPADINVFNSADEIKEYLLEVNDLNNLLWYVICNTGNPILTSTIKHFQDRLYLDSNVNLRLYGSVDATIDELLEYNNVDFKIDDGYNYTSMMKLLINTFTGLSFNTSNEDTEDMDKLLKLVKKILSYSVQILFTPVSSSSIESPYTGDSVLQHSRPMITLTDAFFTPLEDFYGEFFSRDYLFKDLYSAKDEPGDVEVQYCHAGFGFNYKLERTRGVDLAEVSMSLDFECLDLYIPGIDVEVKAKGDGIIDISNNMDMDIVVLLDRDDIALVHFNRKDEYVNYLADSNGDYIIEDNGNRIDIGVDEKLKYQMAVNDTSSLNMSIDYTSVDIHRFVDTRDAFVIENGSVTVTPGLILNDYIIDDRNLNIGDISLFTQKSVNIVAENIITDEDIGYEDRDVPLGDSNIRETRSISTIIKVENRDDE